MKMMIPHKSVELAVGGTLQDSRTTGVGTLLTKTLFNKALESGYENCITDCRIANLSSSNFWPKQGFEPIAYRMVRHIDKRVYWANGIQELNK